MDAAQARVPSAPQDSVNPTHTIDAWAFPRHRPQMYAPSTRVLRSVPAHYSFGRQITTGGRVILATAVAVPGLRSLVATRDALQLPFSQDTFDRILAGIGEVVGQSRWAAFQSAWHSQRLIVFSFNADGTCTGVTHVTTSRASTFHPRQSGKLVQVPRVLEVTQIGEWELRIEESLPRWHRAHPWDPTEITRVVDDARSILGDRLGSPPQPDWVPLHGDLTPWNLRVAPDGQPWLIDWEWAEWGPERADLLRFAIAHCSLSMNEPDGLIDWIDRNVEASPRHLAEAATYWLQHRMYRDVQPSPDSSEGAGIETERENARTEVAALRTLAGRA